MAARSRRPALVSRAVFDRTIGSLRKHIATVEENIHQARGALELQFRRIASIQAELDQLQAHLRRTP